MYKYLIFSVLLACTLTQENPDRYFLSPPQPPTAFVGQYYTVQFRVIGVDNPKFSFSNLPPFLKGYSDGTIEGAPDKLGSFVAKIRFQSPATSGFRDIVFRVASSDSDAKIVENVSMGGEKLFALLNDSLTYAVGDKLNITLVALNGKPTYTWSYINLPPQLNGNIFGTITGIFNIEGYYSFAASVSDNSGVAADLYLTINIQPRSARGSPLIQVPFRNIPMVYDIQQVQAQQQAATISVFNAIRTAKRRQAEEQMARADYSRAVLSLQFATAQESMIQQNIAKSIQFMTETQGTIDLAKQKLSNSTRALALVAISYQNALSIFNYTQKEVSDSLSKAADAARALQEQNGAFIRAQTESANAVQAIKAAITTSFATRNIYALLFESYSSRKKELQFSLQKRQQADNLVANAMNAVNLINQINDNAQSDLALASNSYVQASENLENAEKLSRALREQLSNSSILLGNAKFKLQQALNDLYIAQAVKEQADKATAIVRAQTSSLPTESLIASLFGGCQRKAYPLITGSAWIESFNRFGYRLSSGGTLLVGSCTQGSLSISQGNVIKYEGYIKDGFIHAILVEAVK